MNLHRSFLAPLLALNVMPLALLAGCGMAEENTVLELNDLAEHVAFLQFGSDPADQTAFVTLAAFDDSADGAAVDLTLTITNTGPTEATSISYSGLPDEQMGPPFDFKGGVFPGTGGDCSITLGPGESCDIVLTFDPDDGVSQTFEDEFRINYDNGLVEFFLVVALAGIATDPTP